MSDDVNQEDVKQSFNSSKVDQTGGCYSGQVLIISIIYVTSVNWQLLADSPKQSQNHITYTESRTTEVKVHRINHQRRLNAK